MYCWKIVKFYDWDKGEVLPHKFKTEAEGYAFLELIKEAAKEHGQDQIEAEVFYLPENADFETFLATQEENDNEFIADLIQQYGPEHWREGISDLLDNLDS